MWIFVTMLAAATAMTLSASEPERTSFPPPSPRAPKPAGKVLFWDGFTDGDLKGWRPDRGGVWSVRRGVLRADLPDMRQLHSFLYAGSADWTDYAVDLDVCAMRGVDKGVAVRVMDGMTGVVADLRGPGYEDLVLYRRDWPMGKARVLNANGAWHHLRVEARQHRYRVWVDGAMVLDKTDPRRSRPSGGIALAGYTGGAGECTIYYDNVLVTALDPDDGR